MAERSPSVSASGGVASGMAGAGLLDQTSDGPSGGSGDGSGSPSSGVVSVGGDPLIGTVLGDRYRLEMRVGEGGMGVVYQAEHLALKTKVAVKVLVRSAGEVSRKRFLLEAQMASKVRHPNVVYLADYGLLPDGRPYLVMEFLRGPTLADALRNGRLSPLRACRIAAQIARGMQTVHDQGIVHRGPTLPSRSGHAASAPVETLRKMASRRLFGFFPRAVRGSTDRAGSVHAAATGSLPVVLGRHCAVSRCARCMDSGAVPSAVLDARCQLTRTGARPA